MQNTMMYSLSQLCTKRIHSALAELTHLSPVSPGLPTNLTERLAVSQALTLPKAAEKPRRATKDRDSDFLELTPGGFTGLWPKT